MPLLIESVVSAALSRVAVMPDGGPDFAEQDFEGASMPLLIESVVSAALSRVAVMPDGGHFC
ncbi:hypothetical protein BHS30_29380 [Klebsiella pneumoniae]|nr:hypothetical protein BHS30_29380 [Klebsiella pneumoniae]